MTAFLLAAWLAANNASYAKIQVFRPGSGEHIFTNFSGRNCLPVFRHDGRLHSDNRTGAYAVSYNVVPGQPKTIAARTCARCGNVYEGALHGRYCGGSCKHKAHRERKKYGNAQTSKQLRTCARCGVQFEGALHGRYHSDACKQKAYRERKARKAVTV